MEKLNIFLDILLLIEAHTDLFTIRECLRARKEWFLEILVVSASNACALNELLLIRL